MRDKRHLNLWHVLLAALLLVAATCGRAALRQAQNTGDTSPAQAPDQPPPANPDTANAAPPQDPSQTAVPPDQDKAKEAAADKTAPAQSPQATPESGASKDAAKDATKDPAKHAAGRGYSLTSAYSVTLPQDWVADTKNEIPPPAPLVAYAPPFHLSGNLILLNPQRGAILQFATSDNPFIGHDAYWLDTQMHSPTGSGMSLLDFFFYYFFPPSDACMNEVLTTYAPASRVSADSDSPSYMQVYYKCPLSDTLSDFYSTQVSAGITFQLTDNGTRVLAPVGDFYVAPMEQIEESGITFFIFEAQGMNSVTSDAARRFHLPDNSQGGPPDFFWAIAAASPFPFVADSGRKDGAILHVAYARIGVDTDAKTEFMNILREIRTH
jgi:hypothetical protein